MTQRIGGCSDSAIDTKLIKDVDEMAVDGPFTDTQLASHRLIGQTICQQTEHLRLAGTEVRKPGSGLLRF
jgi:hypothetical protein